MPTSVLQTRIWIQRHDDISRDVIHADVTELIRVTIPAFQSNVARKRSDMNNLDPMSERREQAFLFDLDGTLLDSVYQHVLASRDALEAPGIHISVCPIHRRIGHNVELSL